MFLEAIRPGERDRVAHGASFHGEHDDIAMHGQRRVVSHNKTRL
ncbi:MAG: hypothetical protein Q6373_004825 [Candidatus Sigynarchaeota archaeon]